MNIGIFGGTFNPPHIGHLLAAQSVLEQGQLDKIIFVPSYITPHKNNGEEILAHHRLTMTKLAIQENLSFECSDIEIQKQGTSYTYQTLEYFQQQYPAAKFFLIIGIDNFITFEQWKFPEKILKMATLLVINRPPKQTIPITKIPAKHILIPDIEISSTTIRSRVKNNLPIRYYVTPKVEEYIIKNLLYNYD